MATEEGNSNLALFCDFENVALGVRDAKLKKIDIKLILERVLIKGNVVVKKAYCDWERYKEFKAIMHDTAFELIEIPHTRQSGKNSADIRMVVDALDLCYTKEHIDTFVIISGDSDFSPLVSKLRENDKIVIGIGVRNSTSDLLMHNCDEFIYYEDLVRDQAAKENRQKKPAPRKEAARQTKATPKKSAKQAKAQADDGNLDEAIRLVLEISEELSADQGHGQRLWGSMVKQTLKRRFPGFNERSYGAKAFSDLLEEAESRGLMKLEHDERSGGYTIQLINEAR